MQRSYDNYPNLPTSQVALLRTDEDQQRNEVSFNFIVVERQTLCRMVRGSNSDYAGAVFLDDVGPRPHLPTTASTTRDITTYCSFLLPILGCECRIRYIAEQDLV
ncbi:hypothetical protein PoB_004288300 [Plakobranchus ocellatus]|uniref:Uncharacterized protein n=1 Tax=Plakobranchus ocellatus TaxID=259542 RepID=A0AAV4BC28_9GAST|nr:hypothetical protein PoB_004288300 [Plakobranchus ocellatus]